MTNKASHNKTLGKIPPDELLETITSLFQTLGDTTRVKILYALQEKEICVKDLAQLVGISQSGISHQLSYLRKLKFVRTRKDGNTVYYALRYKHLLAMLKEAEYYADHIARDLPDHPYK